MRTIIMNAVCENLKNNRIFKIQKTRKQVKARSYINIPPWVKVPCALGLEREKDKREQPLSMSKRTKRSTSS